MEAVNRKNLWQAVSGGLINIIVAYISFVAAFISSKFIKLPVHDSYSISNHYLASGYAPEVNFVRLIWIILVGAAIFWFLRRTLNRQPRLFRWLVAAFMTLGVFGAFAVPTVNSFIGNLDTFHHGEQLSPGLAFDHGKHLYTDLFVLHGAGEDVLVPALALHLPGTAKDGGIGSYYFLTATLEVLSAFVFFLFLARYLRSTAIFLIASFWFIVSPYTSFFYVRDLFVWSLLIMLWYVFHGRFKGGRRVALLVTIGAVASAALVHAVDRGLISMFLVVASAALLLVLKRTRDGLSFQFRWPRQSTDWFASLYIAAGVVGAQLIFLIIIGGNAYIEFLKTTFVALPKYDGLLFNSPLPNASATSYSLWLPIFLGILGVLMLAALVRIDYKTKRYSTYTVLGGLLLATSIVFLRTGYGRPDSGHIAYATPLLFVTLFYLGWAIWKYGLREDYTALWMPVLLAVGLLLPTGVISMASLSILPSINPKVAVDYLKLPGRSNDYWVPPQVATVAKYIRANTKPTDSVFVFTQQPIYYYLTGRNNPTRFYIPWFADPQPLTNEMLADLKRTPPKYIVFSSGTSWDAPDGYSMTEMAPEVAAWISQNYPTQTMVGPVTLLSK